jgi:hypothetical protein
MVDITDSEEDEQPTRSRKASTCASSKAPGEKGKLLYYDEQQTQRFQIRKPIVRLKEKAKWLPGHVVGATLRMRSQALRNRLRIPPLRCLVSTTASGRRWM